MRRFFSRFYLYLMLVGSYLLALLLLLNDWVLHLLRPLQRELLQDALPLLFAAALFALSRLVRFNPMGLLFMLLLCLLGIPAFLVLGALMGQWR